MIESCGLECPVCKSPCDRIAGHGEGCEYPKHREREAAGMCVRCGRFLDAVDPVVASDGNKCCDLHCIAYYEHGLAHEGDRYCTCGKESH